MFKARYYKADGKKGKALALPDSIFDGIVNEPAMHQVVKAYLSNQRQGTAAAKTRSEVRGGSRKPWRQKGTGRARQGTIRAAQWAGGGVAFPPIPHCWRKRLPKKVRSLARRSALNDRAEHDRVIVADLPSMDAPKTRDMVGFLGALELGGKTLILTNGTNHNVYMSARNLEQVEVLPFGNESVYDVLWAQTVVIEKSALEGVDGATEKKEAAPKKKAAAKKKEAAPKKEAAAKKKAAPKKKAAAKKPAAETEDAPKTEAVAEAPVADDAPEAVEAAVEDADAVDSAADESEEKTDA